MTDVAPLAERLRPTTIEGILGQDDLLGPEGPLNEGARSRPQSLILWGPPGTGKTTLGILLARSWGAQLVSLSAVQAGVREVRAAAEAAEARLPERTVLFLDEIHRFSRSQQDVLLPWVEKGVLVLIGATTENPAFALNGALLSRTRVVILRPLGDEALERLVDRALKDALFHPPDRPPIALDAEARGILLRACDRDARRLLNYLEVAAHVARSLDRSTIGRDLLGRVLGEAFRKADKSGDWYYDLLSAMHKSLRGSSPDATLYWVVRLFDAGVDPRIVARRLLRAASEDVGLADPAALGLTLHAWETYERLGEPEGLLALAQAAVYLAATEKSNSVYLAHLRAEREVRNDTSREVPLYLRNAPTNLARELGHGVGYRYPHDEPEGYAPGVSYMPAGLEDRRYYRPGARGFEKRFKDRLEHLKELDRRALSRGDAGGGDNEREDSDP